MAIGDQFDYGSVVRIATLPPFKVEGVATDPTTVTLRVKDPTGAVTVWTYALGQLIRDGTGDYHRDVTCAIAGYWATRLEGTGTCAAVADDFFLINASPFYP